MTQTSNKQQLQAIVNAARERRAEDITVLDLTEVSTSLDYFVICTATAGPQVNAVHEHIREEALTVGLERPVVEGPSDRWLLLAFGHIVVHIMTKDAREFYDLEGLWSDAEHIVIPEKEPEDSHSN